MSLRTKSKVLFVLTKTKTNIMKRSELRQIIKSVIKEEIQGIVTDKDARKLGVGGEVICYVW